MGMSLFHTLQEQFLINWDAQLVILGREEAQEQKG